MKKLLLAILIVLITSPAYAATWYAQKGSCNFDSVSGTTISDIWCSVDDDADCSGGSWLDWSTGPHANDVFEASAETGIVINVDPTGTHDTSGRVHLKNTAGGNYSFALATAPATTSIDITAGGAPCVLITGTTAGKTLGVAGSTFTASPTTALAHAVASTHTTNAVAIVANLVGSSGSTGAGFYTNNNASAINLTGNATAASGIGLNNSGNAVSSITGNCIGSSTAASYAIPGCYCNGSGGLTVNGSIINGSSSSGAQGKIIWNPTAPGSGVGHYFKSDGGGTAVFVGKATVSDTISTKYVIRSTDGVPTVGTAASGGGGAYAW